MSTVSLKALDLGQLCLKISIRGFKYLSRFAVKNDRQVSLNQSRA